MSNGISTHLLIALLEAGWEKDRMLAAVEKVTKAQHPLTASVALLIEAGIGDEKLIEVFTDLERDYVDYARQLGLAAITNAPRRYQRALRTKKYGPAQDPNTYFSAEKLRAYNLAAAWVDAPAVERLPAGEWWPLVGAVYRRDNFTCTYCGADGDEYVLHCDHIVPVSRGGPNVIENLTTACDYCNSSKRDRLPHEWRPVTGVPQ